MKRYLISRTNESKQSDISIFRSYLPKNKEYKFTAKFPARVYKKLYSDYLWEAEAEGSTGERERGGREKYLFDILFYH